MKKFNDFIDYINDLLNDKSKNKNVKRAVQTFWPHAWDWVSETDHWQFEEEEYKKWKTNEILMWQR
jgi:L-lactate utilization protein LutB